MRERREQALCMDAYKASLGCIVLNKRCFTLYLGFKSTAEKNFLAFIVLC